jgi:hypothetical protein
LAEGHSGQLGIASSGKEARKQALRFLSEVGHTLLLLDGVEKPCCISSNGRPLRTATWPQGWKKERALQVAGRPDRKIVLVLPGDGEVHQRKVSNLADLKSPLAP